MGFGLRSVKKQKPHKEMKIMYIESGLAHVLKARFNLIVNVAIIADNTI